MSKLLFLVLITFLCSRAAAVNQCFKCRSRGELGICRDDFPYNATTGKGLPGIDIVSCPSGWCSKKIEGIRGPPDDFGTASERACLTQAPSDREERCVEIKRGFKTILHCFCDGNLCNSSIQNVGNWFTILISILFLRRILS